VTHYKTQTVSTVTINSAI